RRVDHPRLRVRRQDGGLLFQLLRQPDIVGVDEGDVVAARAADAQVACRAHAAVLVAGVVQVAYPGGVQGGVAPGDRSAAVGRAIVDQQQLPVGVGLSEYAGDRLVEVALGV